MKRELEPFYRSLKCRGLSVALLAEVTASGRDHLYKTFAGIRGAQCKTTRLRVMVWLTDEECQLLGWDPEERPKLPQGCLLHVEQTAKRQFTEAMVA